jgi:uncharacterized protein YlxW (UPF0749 family)
MGDTMSTDYKALALEMNRFYCIGQGHLASDLLLDAINKDKDKDNQNNETSHAPTSDYTDYLLNELDRIQKKLATLTTEITKWTKTQ